MNSSKIKLIAVGNMVLFGALYLGISAATAQFETVAWVVGVVTLIGCAVMGRRIWLLLPLLMAVKLTVMIPGRPSAEMIGQALVVGFATLMFLMRRLPFKLRITELEVWMILLLLCVVQVYARNPVSVDLFGGDTVGGRPYVLFAGSAAAAVLLCGLLVPPHELRTAMSLTIVGGFINLVVGFVGWLVPTVGYWVGMASASALKEFSAEDTGRATRVNFLVNIPLTLARWVSSFANPIAACFSPRWAPLILLSLAFAAISGYRNVVGAVAFTYIVGVFYRGGGIQLFISVIGGAIGLAMLSAINVVSPLPANIQRAVSFLPGTWEKRYVEDAKDSTEWRLEMWREALLTDRWINDKVLGDGLGFTARELEYQKGLQAMHATTGRGITGLDAAREYTMINGDYHSGPVSAIRTIGYVGLLIMALAQIRLVVHAHRQIMRCMGTEWYPVALFFGIPIIWNPVFFWLIFGGFAGDAPFILLSAGMLRMLENNLPLPAYVPGQRRVAMPGPVLADRKPVPVG